MSPKILVVEDDQAIREMLRFVLQQKHFDILEAENAEQALRLIHDRSPSLILLDWMLPGMSGVDLARKLKEVQETSNLPIIMITAKGEEEDMVRGLDSGADDYVTKPFSPRELVARIRAVLRRAVPHKNDEPVGIRGLMLDPTTHRVTIEEELVEMGPTEFRLLHFFMTHQDRVYSRSQLLDWVWGTNSYVEERTVDVYVRRLRKVLELEQYDKMLQTIRGVGYRFSQHAA
ncbi:MAG: phosphate regulon transcriptional regulatory protein PhoB [Acidiferrobacteraceae bacterium]|nr:phosphate regulon transcriptional regulatory protein PhoB [Acidiferrobacteraceae bacterium]